MPGVGKKAEIQRDEKGGKKGVPLDNEHIVTHRTNNYYRVSVPARALAASHPL